MESRSDISWRIINTRSELDDLVRILEKEKTIGVDLEADSMYHFREKVCLVQIATKTINVVIDPLRIVDLAAIRPIFKTPNIQKIFHGADYDIRSLFRDFQITVNNLFDTELASRFLGIKETSLEAVLKNKFGVSLDKQFQRRDWSKRPLPAEMIAYAAEDVGFLVPLAKCLITELQQKGRLTWVYEECKHLSNVRPNSNDTTPLYLNFKGAGKLDPRSLALLEALLQYRRDVAQKKDKPLFRIISSRSLVDLTEKKPLNLKQLEKSKTLSPKQIAMYGQEVVTVIHGAMKLPKEVLPVYPRKRTPRVPMVVAERVRALRHWRDIQAKKLKIDPALICTRALIGTIAVQRPMSFSSLAKIKEMKNWQRKEFGKDIINVLKHVH
jgi:ribonuclease D